MNKRHILCGLLGIFLMGFASATADPGLIYGKVYTNDGEELQGYIRWDRNEASWGDVIDGDKKLDRRYRKHYRDRYRDDDDDERIFGRNRVEIFGMEIFSSEWPSQASSGLVFGHIKELIPDGDDEVLLILKSGEEVELENGSGDIGEDIREILVDTDDEGIVELLWDDIDRIEFMSSPSRPSKFGKRLYGTLVSRRGDEYSGFIGWDVDEAFDTDILDGEEDRRSRKIEFKDIKMIERRSSKSALVTLQNGKKIRLDDSNDVDDSNRGVVISDYKLGRIVVAWDDFDYLEFKEAPQGIAYDKFDGGKKIRGTVRTDDGKEYKGEIKWDTDEEYTWEFLDGKLDEIDFSIEFGNIASINRSSRSGAEVTLKDGRKFRLRDSNDVDDDNKGIVIISGDKDEDEVIVDWHEFESATFE